MPCYRFRVLKTVAKTPFLANTCPMGRPRKDIRLKRHTESGRWMAMYLEDPGHWHATPEHDEAAALKWARRYRGTVITRSRPALTICARNFFRPYSPWVAREKAKGREFVAKYLETRCDYLDNYVIRDFGDRRPETITRREVDDWALTLTSKRSGKPLSGATRNKILYTFSIVLEELVDRGVLERNPLEGLRPYSKHPLEPRGVFSQEDLAKMFPEAGPGPLVRIWGGSMWAATFLLLSDTGIRPGELRALTWRDWWADDRFLPIRKAIESGTAATVKTTKSGSARPVFVSKRTAAMLDQWKTETPWPGVDDFIFTALGSAPVSNQSIVQAFRAGLKRAGLVPGKRSPYWLRHSFNTYALEKLGQADVQTLMGHRSDVMTRNYRHPDDASLLREGLPIRDALMGTE